MVRSREVSGLIPLIRSDPSQLNRPWPEKSVESILIIHHYPTFSGGLVLQLGLARSSGPHFPAARASITRRRQLASHNGQAHTLQPLPPRFLYKYLLLVSHIYPSPFEHYFRSHARPAALTPGRLWVAARLCQHVHRLIYLATNCCHRTNNFLRDL